MLNKFHDHLAKKRNPTQGRWRTLSIHSRRENPPAKVVGTTAYKRSGFVSVFRSYKETSNIFEPTHDRDYDKSKAFLKTATYISLGNLRDGLNYSYH